MSLGGMVGELLAPGGEVCPMVVPAPFKVGEDITTNGVCCAAYRNPPHQRHTSRPLPDQSLEVASAPHPSSIASHSLLIKLTASLLSPLHSAIHITRAGQHGVLAQLRWWQPIL